MIAYVALGISAVLVALSWYAGEGRVRWQQRAFDRRERIWERREDAWESERSELLDRLMLKEGTPFNVPRRRVHDDEPVAAEPVDDDLVFQPETMISVG